MFYTFSGEFMCNILKIFIKFGVFSRTLVTLRLEHLTFLPSVVLWILCIELILGGVLVCSVYTSFVYLPIYIFWEPRKQQIDLST